ncbi:hypothetical protein [Streptomyces xinghaiensis]|uniref:hypothetical protein n=1 Tax=Streptomyces xinghaiensis TaxID=1038928 RepID=UPI00341AB6E6
MSDKGAPEVGTLTLDVKSGRVGRVMDHLGSRVQLRPPSGGIEWDARPEDLRPVDTSELLAARVAERNANSGGRL